MSKGVRGIGGLKNDEKKAQASFDAALQAIEKKNYALGIKKLQEALDYCEDGSELAKKAQEKFNELIKEGQEKLKEADEMVLNGEKEKAKTLLKKIAGDFKGTEVGVEADKKLKELK
jgi:exonuclease VII small subunit